MIISQLFNLKDKEACQRHDILLTPHNSLCGVENDSPRMRAESTLHTLQCGVPTARLIRIVCRIPHIALRLCGVNRIACFQHD
jgi:hypothetical protein